MPRAYRVQFSPATFRIEDRRPSYAAGTGQRRQPSKALQASILTDQNAHCLYCGCRFGSIIHRHSHRDVVLRLEWDHMVPFEYLRANPDENWAAACHVCNGIKGDRIFDTIEQARNFIVSMRRAKGYWPAEWTQELDDQDERDIREVLAKMPKKPLVRFVGIRPKQSKKHRAIVGNMVKVRQIMFVFEETV